jgi:hypothetical protein
MSIVRISRDGACRYAGVLTATMLSFSVVASVNEGVWVKSGGAAQVNMACSQAWECQATHDILHSSDTYVWHTPNKLTWGVCSAAGGAVDTCNECAVRPPDEPCQWELREKGH